MRTTTAAVALGDNDPRWSEWRSLTFRTGSASASFVTLVAPTVGAAVDSVTPTLAWDNLTKHVFYYEVQVSKDMEFNVDPGTATASVYWELVHGGQSTPENS